jgi:hypothetical protein
MKRNGVLEVLEEDGELVEGRLQLVGEVCRQEGVVGVVDAGPVERAVVDEGLEVLGGVVGEEGVRVGDDDEALLPGVARLQVLDVVLRVQHEGHLLVPRQLVVLVGERGEDGQLVELHHELD